MSGASPTPPPIDGFRPLHLVGTGGFAEVFLYEQLMPLRNVAVKVMTADALSGDAQRRQFTAEANLMAKLSTHPYIVSVFQAGVAADGRPFIVMEYYPGENYLRRARHERFGVADVLRVGIQVGSALETAHRAGILHRDVKPANILTSEFRRPGLTDFGIAAAIEGGGDDHGGVSIPWSPPEAFHDELLGLSADVYSLAATLYDLLAGRSPFEIRGGDNSPLGLMTRIERDQLPPIGRADVPASLERVLGRAMSKAAAHRPQQVIELLRELQMVEAELQLAVTPLELADDGGPTRARSADDDDDRTRVRGVTEIRPQGPTSSAVPISAVPEPSSIAGAAAGREFIAPRRREGMLAEPEVADTIGRSVAQSSAPAPDDEEVDSGRRWIVLTGVFVALVAILVAGVIVFSGNTEQSVTTVDVFGGTVLSDTPPIEPAENVVGTLLPNGGVEFSWSRPGVRLAGDLYLLAFTVGGTPVDEWAEEAWPGAKYALTQAQIDQARAMSSDVEICIEVTAFRPGERIPRSTTGCASAVTG
jgi:serine/threonine protein kinase